MWSVRCFPYATAKHACEAIALIKAAKGKDLQCLCLKINALFRLHFLKIVGFDEQEINEIVDECPYLKGQCNS